MKKILLISLLLLAFQSYGSHLAGGEITYKYMYNSTYQVDVTLYRDCADCKLGGDGGGTSTANCSDLEELFIRTNSTACGNLTIGKIELDKVGYRNITQLCDGDASKCENNSTYPYGFEAHSYRGVIDFSKYASYTGCDIQLYINKSDRNSGITTLSAESSNFYTYAMIYPWGTGFDSPKFKADPQLVFTVNTPVRLNDGALPNHEDSLSYKWSTPLSNYQEDLSYNTGYNPSYFVSAYCPSGGSCASNAQANPPIGISLNSNTGNFVFTPTAANQIGTRVLEIEQWQKRSGEMKLIGKVRRDVLVMVVNGISNNHPKIIADEEYVACVGQELQITITAQDDPTQLAGSTQPADSVRFTYYKSSDSIYVSTNNTSTAPYSELTLSFTPRTEHIGYEYITIIAHDNNCPKNAVTYKTIRIRIRPIPIADFNVKDLFCGNNEITLEANTTGSFGMTISNDDEILFNDEIEDKHVYYQNDSMKLYYKLDFVSNDGCMTSAEKEYINGGNANVSPAVFSGPLSYCENATTNISVSHLNYPITSTEWYTSNSKIDSNQVLDVPAYNGETEVFYTLKKSDMICVKDKLITLVTIPIPVVSFDLEESYCHTNQVLDLAELNALPAGGNWTSEAEISEENTIDFNQFSNQNHNPVLAYTFTNSITGCSNIVSKTVNILTTPELILKDYVVCGSNNTLRLTNLISRPYNPSTQNITWSCIEDAGAILNEHPLADLDIPALGVGTYNIIGTNRLENGCSTVDTGWIRVDKGLTIETNGLDKLCQTSEGINLDTYLELNAPGGGWVMTQGDDRQLASNVFTPEICGNYKFSYVYDMYGCYDEEQFDINVICKPKFEFDFEDTLCDNSEGVHLPTFNLGNWEGDGVLDGKFEPNGFIGHNTIVFTTRDIEGCVFDTAVDFTVLEELQISISELPEQLCENEVLEFTIDQNNYSNFEIKVCGNELSQNGNNVSYIPGVCDLERAKIQLNIITSSNLNCPSANQKFVVPYHTNPTAITPNPVDECWPAVVSLDLEIGKGFEPTYTSLLSNTSAEIEGTSLTYTDLFPGSYTLTVNSIDKNGCSNEQVFEDAVRVHSKPDAEFYINKEDKISLSERDLYFVNSSFVEDGDLDHQWFAGKAGRMIAFSNEVNPVYELPADTGLHIFKLITTSNSNCSDTAFDQLLVVPDIIAFIPNAFTPNKKGPPENNTFNITSSNVAEFHIQIFNKWGQQVFESYDINNSWDGTYQGEACHIGVYVYVIQLKNKSGIDYKYDGAVNILR